MALLALLSPQLSLVISSNVLRTGDAPPQQIMFLCLLVIAVILETSIALIFQKVAHFPRKTSIQMAIEDPPIRSKEWAAIRGLEPGYGGYWPGNPDAKKYKVTIKSQKTGEEVTAMVPNDRYIYMYFEEQGIEIPVINKARMCRQGCCTICTAKLDEGSKVKMDAPLGLLKDFREDGYALTCCSLPRSDIVCVLQDEDEMYIRQWADGFEGGGKEWGGVFMDED